MKLVNRTLLRIVFYPLCGKNSFSFHFRWSFNYIFVMRNGTLWKSVFHLPTVGSKLCNAIPFVCLYISCEFLIFWFKWKLLQQSSILEAIRQVSFTFRWQMFHQQSRRQIQCVVQITGYDTPASEETLAMKNVNSATRWHQNLSVIKCTFENSLRESTAHKAFSIVKQSLSENRAIIWILFCVQVDVCWQITVNNHLTIPNREFPFV